jgi:hypothetical protein
LNWAPSPVPQVTDNVQKYPSTANAVHGNRSAKLGTSSFQPPLNLEACADRPRDSSNEVLSLNGFTDILVDTHIAGSGNGIYCSWKKYSTEKKHDIDVRQILGHAVLVPDAVVEPLVVSICPHRSVSYV